MGYKVPILYKQIFLFYVMLAAYGLSLLGLFGGHWGCPIKMISGYPCPSCGITRSVYALMRGDILLSLHLNPLGPLFILLSVVLLVLLFRDFMLRDWLLDRLYGQLNQWLKDRIIWIIPIVLILMLVNWIWNIEKGL